MRKIILLTIFTSMLCSCGGGGGSGSSNCETKSIEPVCTKDALTFDNECFAKAADQEVDYDGACL